MIISKIEEFTKNRSKVYIDQEFAFVLYKGELRLFGIKEDAELSDENYHKILTEILPKRAKMRAMNLLQSRDYTRSGLADKLRQGLYPETVIEEALDYVASYRYIDDVRYAKSYIHYNHERKSRRIIEQDLQRKGVSKLDVERAWCEWKEEGNGQDEEELILRLLEKKKYSQVCGDAKERQKVYAFLMRKGFSGDTVNRAMKRYENGQYTDDFYLT
ncbi:MAG: regulatory protein RecX [Lachnospiraceae bacterium]|nr:regulatory protein RecX [Lachnospiraceae bacterium]